MHKRVLHGEVLRVMEHSDRLSICLLGPLSLFGGYGAGGSVFVIVRYRTVLCDGSHYDSEYIVGWRERRNRNGRGDELAFKGR